MNRSLSIFLDALRFLAALIVFGGHFTEPYFSRGLTDRTQWAVSAVAVFFVLSGFVISHVTTVKEKNSFDYATARVARLYSVLVPALLLTALVHLIALRLDPGFIASWIDSSGLAHTVHRTLPRLAVLNLITLSFLNGLHGHDLNVPLDSPVWSLGFEAPYYALFGIALFTRGAKRLALTIVCCALFGYGILSLFPVWLSGVALHRLTLRINRNRSSSAWIIVGCMVLACAMLIYFHAFEIWISGAHGKLFSAITQPRGRAGPALLFYFWALIAWLAILAAFAAEQLLNLILIPLERPIRWCARHTFSLYLFHFPLLILVYVVTHYDRSSHLDQAIVLAVVFLLCVLLSEVSEKKKGWWRSTMRRFIGQCLPTP
jgi:peptidoglycan/LPS O-acetylase OafA/YrhL